MGGFYFETQIRKIEFGYAFRSGTKPSLAKMPIGREGIATSAGAMKDAIDFGVFGFALGAGCRAPTDFEKRVVRRNRARRGRHWLEARDELTAMGKQESSAFGNAAQNGLNILTELEHGHDFHRT